MRRRRPPAVPAQLVHEIDEALAAVDTARAHLARARAEQVPLLELRAASAEVRGAFDRADALLRHATGLARQHSYREWSAWRHRLSVLGTARVMHLFAEQDEVGLLPIGSVRAIDTGMSGPAIGDLQHGASRAPGTPPTYGLDFDALLTGGPATAPPTGADRAEPPVVIAFETSSARDESPPEAA